MEFAAASSRIDLHGLPRVCCKRIHGIAASSPTGAQQAVCAPLSVGNQRDLRRRPPPPRLREEPPSNPAPKEVEESPFRPLEGRLPEECPEPEPPKRTPDCFLPKEELPRPAYPLAGLPRRPLGVGSKSSWAGPRESAICLRPLAAVSRPPLIMSRILIRGIVILSFRSMALTAPISSRVIKVQACPLCSERPVRPIRWV